MDRFVTSQINIWFDRLLQLAALCSGILIVFLMLSVCWEVVMRYFFNSPTIWVVELASYSVLWITFLGAPWILKEKGHVKMDLLLEALSWENRRLFNLITSLFAAGICLLVGYYGTVSTIDLYQTGFKTQTVLMLPKWPLVSVIPLGMFLTALELCRKSIFLLTSDK